MVAQDAQMDTSCSEFKIYFPFLLESHLHIRSSSVWMWSLFYESLQMLLSWLHAESLVSVANSLRNKKELL